MSKVEIVMREFKKKKLRTNAGKRVTGRKQAVAIALSEARRHGEDVSPAPKK